MKKIWLFILMPAIFLAGCQGSRSKSDEQTEVTISESTPEIFVDAVEGMSDDFILGCDVSSMIAEEKSGVVFYNDKGEEQDLLLTLAENGVNTIRIRVWNDPYDGKGYGYGGGNNDVDTAIEIGKRATQYGMGCIIDFHYSDFWADPAKQMCPKAWEEMDITEKSDALYQFTYDSLKKILDAKVNVTMVQIGNETTTGMSGETKWSNIAKLMTAGSKAIRDIQKEYDKDILIAVHFTNPENAAQYEKFALTLYKFDIDYDVFASSYYPYWHGTLDNLKEILQKIATEYGKKVMVMEISYAYTYEDKDGFANSINADSSCEFPYALTVQGQADCIRDVAAAVASIKDAGIGICYWEPAWIPVPGSDTKERQLLWQKYGSGWASSFASEYDPDDAGVYYGGSSWDNQAMFDSAGHPLASLSVFRLLKTGATTEIKIDSLVNPTVTVRIGNEIKYPDKVTASLNNGEAKELDVAWDTSSMDKTPPLGTYQVTGKATYEGKDFEATCTVKIVELNYLNNTSFEEDDLSMWKITNIDDATSELFVIDKKADAVTGTKSLHFYSNSAEGVNFTVEQSPADVPEGSYKFSLTIHGGDASTQDIEIYAIADGVTYTAPATITKWAEYKYPVITGIKCTSGTITVGARVTSNTGSWGNLDDFILAPDK